MTASERVKQELGWWIEGGRLRFPVGQRVERHRDTADIFHQQAFALALRLAEENERLKKQMEEK